MSTACSIRSFVACAVAVFAAAVHADVTIGVVLSETGPTSSLGILEKNGVQLAAATTKEKFRFVFLDDATDPAEATRAARRLVVDEKVDAIIGTTSTPAALAMMTVVAEGGTPTISQAPSNVLVAPVEGPRRWMFKTTTNDDHDEGVFAPFAAVMNVGQLPDDDAGKKGAAEFVRAYEARHGAGTANIFSAGAWDAVKLLDAAVPAVAKSLAPGTPEFRAALRTALENLKNVAGARGVYNTSASDHTGLDANALRVGRYAQGRWLLEK